MLRAPVRRFLARGRLARLAACLVVAFAAVVWIAVASVVLRVLFAAVLLLFVIWCVLLIIGVGVGQEVDPGRFGGHAWRMVFRSARRALARAVAEPTSPEDERVPAADGSRGLACDDEELRRRERELMEREAAFAVVRSSLDAVIADLLGGQERLHADAKQLQRQLAGQIEAMRAVVARIAQLEPGVSLLARAGKQEHEHDPRTAGHAAADDPRTSVDADTQATTAQPKPFEPEPADLDQRRELELHAARVELEADLRLEEIEQQEQMLRELEEQLRRREHQLANFVAETQSQLHPRERQRPRPSARLQ